MKRQDLTRLAFAGAIAFTTFAMGKLCIRGGGCSAESLTAAISIADCLSLKKNAPGRAEITALILRVLCDLCGEFSATNSRR